LCGDDPGMREGFRRLAGVITTAVGTPWALLLAIGIVLVWALSGPLFAFSDTWQLAINTGTTVVTFLMVFVIQASQNREAKATQLKLDELIRAAQGARNELIDLENAPDETVELHKEQFREIVAAAQESDPGVLDDVAVRTTDASPPALPDDEDPAPGAASRNGSRPAPAADRVR
jgi:low affinity Fe/Cu permease